MKPLSTVKPILKTLKTRLDELHYDQIQMSLRGTQYFEDPWPIFQDFERKIQGISTPQSRLFELFLLGKALPVEFIEEILTKDLCEGLLEIELLKHKGELVRMENLSIISYLGYYFITGMPLSYYTHNKKTRAIYIGKDSYSLAQKLTVPHDSYLLDLCTGTGIQAIISSPNVRRAIGIELEDEAVKIASYNTILNNVEDTVEIRSGDLYAPLEDEQFDVICSNPPNMAVPPGVKYNSFGNAGEDGLKVLNRVLIDLDDHLVFGGKAIIIGWGIGNNDGPFITERLENISKEKKWSTVLILTYREYLPHHAYNIAATASEMNNINIEQLVFKWKTLYKDLAAEFGYSYFIFINKVNHTRFNIINLSNPWTIENKPQLLEQTNFEESKIYTARRLGKYITSSGKHFSITPQSFEILKLCDGNKTVKEVAKKYLSNYHLEDVDHFSSSFHFDQTLSQLIKLFNSLERFDLMKRNKSVSGSYTSRRRFFSIFKKVK